MGLLMVRSTLVRMQQFVAWGQLPVRVSPMRRVLVVPSVMSAMFTVEFW